MCTSYRLGLNGRQATQTLAPLVLGARNWSCSVEGRVKKKTDLDYTTGTPRAPPLRVGVAGGRCKKTQIRAQNFHQTQSKGQLGAWGLELRYFTSKGQQDLSAWAASCELGLKETNPPTGSTQNRESLGGPTNGRANACRRRRRLAAVELATPLHQEGGFPLVKGQGRFLTQEPGPIKPN